MKIALLNVLSKKEHKLVKGYQAAKGSIIYHEGDVCENIGVIISGKIDIVSYSFVYSLFHPFTFKTPSIPSALPDG